LLFNGIYLKLFQPGTKIIVKNGLKIMYFLCVITSKKNHPVFLVIKKSLKNIKNHYTLEEIITHDQNITDVEIETKIIQFYNDKKYMITKRIFNQNGRPPKKVTAHPKIIVNFTDTQTKQIKGLRKKNIPVEGFSISENESWDKEYCGIGLGNNYFVPLYDLINCMSGLYEQKRLLIKTSIPYGKDLIRELDCLKTKNIKEQNNLNDFYNNNVYDIILALSMALWFRENIPYKSKYITGPRGRMIQA